MKKYQIYGTNLVVSTRRENILKKRNFSTGTTLELNKSTATAVGFRFCGTVVSSEDCISKIKNMPQVVLGELVKLESGDNGCDGVIIAIEDDMVWAWFQRENDLIIPGSTVAATGELISIESRDFFSWMSVCFGESEHTEKICSSLQEEERKQTLDGHSVKHWDYVDKMTWPSVFKEQSTSVTLSLILAIHYSEEKYNDCAAARVNWINFGAAWKYLYRKRNQKFRKIRQFAKVAKEQWLGL